MLKYSRAAFNIIISELKFVAKIFKYGMLIFTTIYYIYALIAKTGILVVNIVLASLFLIYTIFDFVTDKKKNKKTRKIVKRSYKWVSLALKAFTLGVSIYGMYIGTKASNPISIILTTLMLILWILQALLELMIIVLDNKKELIFTAIKKDLSVPLSAINIFKKDKFDIPDDDDKNVQILNEYIVDAKIKKKKEKQKRKSA